MPAERTTMRQVREVLRLGSVGGVSTREIARRIGVAASTVRAMVIADDIDETSIPITTHDVVAGISRGVWRETVKDFLVGRSFRRDIFVRGPVELTPAE